MVSLWMLAAIPWTASNYTSPEILAREDVKSTAPVDVDEDPPPDLVRDRIATYKR